MTREIFEDILLDFDSKLTEPVVLLLDNFSAHNIQSSVILKNVIPIYLPPNTTSKSQPFDAGIIATFKVKYKAKLLKFIGGRMLHRNFSFKDITIHLIIPWIRQAFDEIGGATIERYFAKTLTEEAFEPSQEPENSSNLLALQNLMSDYTGRYVTMEDVVQYAFTAEKEIENQHILDI